MELIWIALIAFSAGLVKGTSGFGSSLVAFPLLILFYDEGDVVVMMLTFNVLLNTLLLFENRAFEISSLKNVWVLTLFGSLATLVGLYSIGELDGQLIKYIASALIFFAIGNKLFNIKIRLKDNAITQAIIGILSGLGNGIASIDGPPVVFFLTSINASKARFKNTLATYFLALGAISVVILISLGKYNIPILLDILYISLFASIGVVIGMVISKRINEKVFSMVIVVLLLALGISMLL